MRDPQDVLDALYGVGTRRATVSHSAQGSRLQAVLDRVGAGNDTVAKLTAADAPQGAPVSEVLVALAELELGGAVARGDGGRYVVCM